VDKNIVELKDLRNICDYKKFDFKTTKSLSSEITPIGQDRAIEAITTALNIKKKGFNLFLSGQSGCGKSSVIKAILERKAKNEDSANDWIYFHNFDNDSKPIVVEVKRGTAKAFTKDLHKVIDEFTPQISKTYESKVFKNERKAILKEYDDKEIEIEQGLSQKMREFGFVLGKSDDGYTAAAFNEKGEILSSEDLLKLGDKEREKIEKNQRKIQVLTDKAYKKSSELDKKIRKKFEKHLDKVILDALDTAGFPEINKAYKFNQNIKGHLKNIKDNIIDNAHTFAALLIDDSFLDQYKRGKLTVEELTKKYRVNLFINNEKQKGAPVIIDNNPTITSIFGMIEYVDDPSKGPVTSFLHIKPGKIHQANGGYLVLEAMDLYKNPRLWEMLKRVIKNQEIQIGDDGFINSSRIAVRIEPEPIPVNIKVILVGTPGLHDYFMSYDDNFDRLFKVTADFNSEIPRNEENEFKYASFIGSKCTEDELLHLDRKAVSKVIEHSSWLIEDQFMLSTNFSKIVDLLVESDYIARKEGKKVISSHCIEETIKKIDYRLKKENEEFQRWIKENIIYIKTTTSLVGEINGLTVLTSGEYSFGLPVRITAKTYVGDLGIVNIEREVRMSGKIHDKGVMTLSGYMGNLFGQNKPLSFESSITFEQQYYHIDGDSASSTELYAILSSLSEVPIKQNIAVTGSVNQNGEIQPIGGVNEKIEGFYDICKHRGIENNAVMIPKSNVRNLMLKQEIIDSVKKGEFAIYAIETIDEGIEILTGVKAGSLEEEGTVFYKANKKLESFYSALKDEDDDSETEKTEKKEKTDKKE